MKEILATELEAGDKIKNNGHTNTVLKVLNTDTKVMVFMDLGQYLALDKDCQVTVEVQ